MRIHSALCFSFVGALVLGCAESPPSAAPVTTAPAPAAPSPTDGAATAEPEPGSAPSASEAAPPGPPPQGKRAPCTLGQDQTCNDDPSVSALWGRCTELGVCECNAGFELSPRSARCQPAH